MKNKIIKFISLCSITICITSCMLDKKEPIKEREIKGNKINYTEELVIDKKVKNEVYLGSRNLEGMSIEEVRDILTDYAKETDVEPKNASFNKETWKTEPEIVGRKLNIDKTIDLILHSDDGEKIEPIVEEVKPEITSEVISENIVEIGSFATEILDAQEARVSNIEVASEYIDNTQVTPGEEFSFNQTLGRRTKAKGYAPASGHFLDEQRAAIEIPCRDPGGLFLQKCSA